MEGKVKFFNTGKGFGFIAADDGTECFVHHSMVKQGTILRENDRVTFDIEKGDRGLRAINVSLSSSSGPKEENKEEKEEAQENESAEESSEEDTSE